MSELSGMTVEHEGRFYEIGSTHKEYQMDKVWDEDYYVLTLAAYRRKVFHKQPAIRNRRSSVGSEAAYNLNIMRKLSLNILKLIEVGSKTLSLKKKRFAIGTNPEKHLEQIMSL